MSNKPIAPSKNPSGKGYFHDPIQPKERECGKYPFDFRAPTYDNRTSCSISAGHNYGIGYRTPDAPMEAREITNGPIPQKSKAFSPYEIFESANMKG
jgi:hypothetical protein